jgi:hypothetical protein
MKDGRSAVDYVKALRIMFYCTARDTGPIPANILKNLLRAPAQADHPAQPAAKIERVPDWRFILQ